MGGDFLVRFDDTEYAAAVPEEPGTVRLVSAGYLPLRVRLASGGVHHRPPFPGTTVVLGDARYEVIDERGADTHVVVYTLRPWPPDHIVRDQVIYDAALIEAVREERQRLAQRERGRRLLWPLYPIAGLPPEAAQVRWCDRWGLDPVTATIVSGLTEAVVACVWWASLSPGALMRWMALAAVVVGTGVFRAFGAVIAREVTGSVVVAALWRVAVALRGAAAHDPTLLPMTREAFWARLAMADRQKRETDGSLTVRSVLPHLTWTPGARLLGEEDHWWRVAAASVAIERGRVVYAYTLLPETTEGVAAGDVPPPRADAYQQAVLEEVWREWEDLRASGFDVIVSLLPAEVQQRAVGSVGGPRALRSAALISVVLVLAAGTWMALEPTTLNVASGLAAAGDSAWRLLRVSGGLYAPSLFGGWLARYLGPERTAYHAHRAAEWEVLRAR